MYVCIYVCMLVCMFQLITNSFTHSLCMYVSVCLNHLWFFHLYRPTYTAGVSQDTVWRQCWYSRLVEHSVLLSIPQRPKAPSSDPSTFQGERRAVPSPPLTPPHPPPLFRLPSTGHRSMEQVHTASPPQSRGTGSSLLQVLVGFGLRERQGWWGKTHTLMNQLTYMS